MVVIAYDPKQKKVICSGATMPANLEAFDTCHYEPDKKYPGGTFNFSKPAKNQPIEQQEARP